METKHYGLIQKEKMKHPAKELKFYQFTVRAKDLDEAIGIVNEAYPKLSITKESVLAYEVKREKAIQGELF